MMGVLIFLIKIIHVVKGNHLVLSGKIDQIYGLWNTPLTSPVPFLPTVQYFSSANAIIFRIYIKTDVHSIFKIVVLLQL